MIEVGKLIAKQRKFRGISQSELGRRTGTKKEYISRIESGTLPNPTIRTIEKITAGLGITVGQLLSEN